MTRQLVTIPIGFLGCWLGTMLGGRNEAEERAFDELLVRSERPRRASR